MPVAEKNDSSSRLSQLVQHRQCRGAIHPVERAAHCGHLERPEGGAEIIRRAENEFGADTGRRRSLAGRIQHFRLRVEAGDIGAGKVGEGDADLARPAAEVEQTVAGAKADSAGHPFDQCVGIGNAETAVIRGGAAEAAGLERNGGHGKLFLNVPAIARAELGLSCDAGRPADATVLRQFCSLAARTGGICSGD